MGHPGARDFGTGSRAIKDIRLLDPLYKRAHGSLMSNFAQSAQVAYFLISPTAGNAPNEQTSSEEKENDYGK